MNSNKPKYNFDAIAGDLNLLSQNQAYAQTDIQHQLARYEALKGEDAAFCAKAAREAIEILSLIPKETHLEDYVANARPTVEAYIAKVLSVFRHNCPVKMRKLNWA